MAIDPCFSQLLADPRNTVRPPPEHVPLSKVRRAADAAMAQLGAPPLVHVADEVVANSGHTVPVRHYRPSDEPVLPVIVFCHGGGFVWGSIDTHDGICRVLAARTGAAVLSVGYRLSPETRYPGAIEDVLAVIGHLEHSASEAGIDPGRISLCGDSAGAHVALSTAFAMLRKGTALRHLALIYPALDPSCASESQRTFADGPLLTREAMLWFWSCYLGGNRGGEKAAHAPLAADLKDFPPTTIATAENDILRDEGEAFARRLADAQVDVALQRYEGMVHGFLSLGAQSPAIERCIEDICRRLAASLKMA